MEQPAFESITPEEPADQDSVEPNHLIDRAKRWTRKNVALMGAVGIGIIGSPSETKGGDIQNIEAKTPQADFSINDRLADVSDQMIENGGGSYREIVNASYGGRADEVLRAKREYRERSGEYFSSKIDDVSLGRVNPVKTGHLEKDVLGTNSYELATGRVEVVVDQKQIKKLAKEFHEDRRMVKKDVVTHEMLHSTQESPLYVDYRDYKRGRIDIKDRATDEVFGNVVEREPRVADLNRVHQMLFGRPILSPQDSVRSLLAFSKDVVSFEEVCAIFNDARIQYSRSEYDQALRDSESARLNKSGVTTMNGLSQIGKAFTNGKLGEAERKALIRSIIFTAPGLASNSRVDQSGGQIV